MESTSPRGVEVETPLYFTEPLLDQCRTDHPCSMDVLAYRSNDDDDGRDDDDDG